jgi:hypothetical protein
LTLLRKSKTPFPVNIALKVLFFLLKHILSKESHYSKSISGKGLFGSIHITADSTFGGGLKFFLPTLNNIATLETNYTLTESQQYIEELG